MHLPLSSRNNTSLATAAANVVVGETIMASNNNKKEPYIGGDECGTNTIMNSYHHHHRQQHRQLQQFPPPSHRRISSSSSSWGESSDHSSGGRQCGANEKKKRNRDDHPPIPFPKNESLPEHHHLHHPIKPASVTETTLYYQLSRLWAKSRGSAHVSFDQLLLLAIVVAWFLVGVIAIVTTKLLATSWQVPPLLLTTQQMILGSSLLRFVLGFSNVQPWPTSSSSSSDSEESSESTTALTTTGTTTPKTTIAIATTSPNERPLDLPDSMEDSLANVSTTIGTETIIIPSNPTNQPHSTVYFNLDFILAGLFNALDILASNSAFHASAASFVETVKASEPITTTIVALLWRIDQLRPKEALSLLVLISGVLLSTYDNATTETDTDSEQQQQQQQPDANEQPESNTATATAAAVAAASLDVSIRTALTVMVANLCFAFRALCQKRYRANRDLLQLNDGNLLFRFSQMGAMTLLVPSLMAHGGLLWQALMNVPMSLKLQYISVAFVNAASFVVYNGASCYVLSNVSVLHHSGLNCLRRMFVTVATCVVFGISLSMFGIFGIVLCFTGFIAFTHSRAMRKYQPHHHATSTGNSSTLKMMNGSGVGVGVGVGGTVVEGPDGCTNTVGSTYLKIQV